MAKKQAPKKSLVSTLGRAALRRGTFGGQRGYLALPVALQIFRTVRKAATKTHEPLGIEKLKAGQFVTITAIPPLTRRERKAVRK
jgi:hypothetical protein